MYQWFRFGSTPWALLLPEEGSVLSEGKVGKGPKPALAPPLHGHLLSGRLMYQWFDLVRPLGLFFSLCPVSKPALARPSSWPLAKSSLQWRFKP